MLYVFLGFQLFPHTFNRKINDNAFNRYDGYEIHVKVRTKKICRENIVIF